MKRATQAWKAAWGAAKAPTSTAKLENSESQLSKDTVIVQDGDSTVVGPNSDLRAQFRFSSPLQQLQQQLPSGSATSAASQSVSANVSAGNAAGLAVCVLKPSLSNVTASFFATLTADGHVWLTDM